MIDKLSRRAVVGGMSAAGLSLAAPSVLRAQNTPSVSFGLLNTGFSILFNQYMAEKRFDLEHGVNLEAARSYTSVGSYYDDFVAGNYEFALGTWDTFAARYIGGVPIKVLASLSTAEMVSIVAPSGGAQSIQDLVGKTVAAPVNSGTYRLTRFVVQDFHDIAFEDQIQVQNVPSPATAVTLAMAGSADGALSWEPNISVGIAREPDLQVIYNLGRDFETNTGIPMPFFVAAVRNEVLDRGSDIAGRLASAVTDCIAGMKANPDEVIALSAPAMDVDPQALQLAFESGRLGLRPGAMSDAPAREAIQNACDLLARHGVLERSVDDGFFAV